MNHNKLLKALECCAVGTFACDEECPRYHNNSKLKTSTCRFELLKDILELVNAQQMQIQELSNTITKQKEEIVGLRLECGNCTLLQKQNNRISDLDYQVDYWQQGYYELLEELRRK